MIFNNIKMALRYIKNSLYYYFVANNDGEETKSQSSQTSQVSEKSMCDKSTQTDEVSNPAPVSFPISVPITPESSTCNLKTTGVQTLIQPPNTPEKTTETEKTMEELTEDVLEPLVNNIIADVMKKMEEDELSDEEDEDAQYIQSKPAPASEKKVKRPCLSPSSPPFIPTAASIERIKMESSKTTSPTFQETLKKNKRVVHNPRIPTPPPLPPIELKSLNSPGSFSPASSPSPPSTFQPKTPLHTYDIPSFPVPNLNLNSFKSEISPTNTEKKSHTIPAPKNTQTLFSVSGSSKVKGLKINEKKLSKYLKVTPTNDNTVHDNTTQKNKPKKLKIRLPPLKEELNRDVPSPPHHHSKKSSPPLKMRRPTIIIIYDLARNQNVIIICNLETDSFRKIKLIPIK